MFKTKSVNIQSLGEHLRARREQLNMTLKEASLASMVQVKYITALEDGCFADLPATVYAKGFLKSLARIYDLDAGHLLEQFESEKQIDDNLTEDSELESVASSVMPKFVISPKTIAIMTVALIGVVSLGYLFSQLRSLSAPPRLEIAAPFEDGQVNSGLLLVRGQTEPGSEVLINNQAIVVDANGTFLENISLALGSNRIVFRAKNKFGEETEVTRTIVYREKEVAGTFSALGAESDELTLEIAIGDSASWISVTADGREVISATMLAGSTRKITAKNRIVLTTGNAGTTRVFLNNRDLGFLGAEGEVLRDIEFTN